MFLKFLSRKRCQKQNEMEDERKTEANNSLSPAQLEQIYLGYEAGLSERQVQHYAKPNIDPFEMWDIREGLLYVVDVPFLVEKYKPSIHDKAQPKYSGWVATLGGICGDIIGSRYEFYLGDRTGITFDSALSKHSRFTDDSVLMVATLDAVLKESTATEIKCLMEQHCNNFIDESLPFADSIYSRLYREYYHKYPSAGFGGGFVHWALEGKDPYRSFGNGSAMRVAPIGEAFVSVEDVIIHAIASASCTHNHPEGVKGAIVTAVCVWMGRHGYVKNEILDYVKKHYKDQNLINQYTMREVRNCNQGAYSLSCQFSVPAAFTCFYESNTYEECIENALSFEGDSDTIAAISGCIAAAFYGDLSAKVKDIIFDKVPESFRVLFV